MRLFLRKIPQTEFEGFKEWMNETGFDTDLIPRSENRFEKILGNSVIYNLPNGQEIRLLTPIGQLNEIDFFLSKFNREEIGIEKRNIC